MSKLTKSVLKEIVKECIVEIFAESFFRDDLEDNEVLSESTMRGVERFNKVINKRPSSRRPQPSPQKPSYHDHVSYGNAQPTPIAQVNERFEQRTSQVVGNLTNDPVMSEIFKDTASTTLQNQNSVEGRRGVSVLAGGDEVAKYVDQSDPTELFAESASKWATLAFADPIKK